MLGLEHETLRGAISIEYYGRTVGIKIMPTGEAHALHNLPQLFHTTERTSCKCSTNRCAVGINVMPTGAHEDVIDYMPILNVSVLWQCAAISIEYYGRTVGMKSMRTGEARCVSLFRFTLNPA
jgi:hypothetical protein